jgi:hypothetical protein
VGFWAHSTPPPSFTQLRSGLVRERDFFLRWDGSGATGIGSWVFPLYAVFLLCFFFCFLFFLFFVYFLFLSLFFVFVFFFFVFFFLFHCVFFLFIFSFFFIIVFFLLFFSFFLFFFIPTYLLFRFFTCVLSDRRLKGESAHCSAMAFGGSAGLGISSADGEQLGGDQVCWAIEGVSILRYVTGRRAKGFGIYLLFFFISRSKWSLCADLSDEQRSSSGLDSVRTRFWAGVVSPADDMYVKAVSRSGSRRQATMGRMARLGAASCPRTFEDYT